MENRPQKNLEFHKILSINKQLVRVSAHADLLLFLHPSVEKQRVGTDGCLQVECIFLGCHESGVSQRVECIIKNRNLDCKDRGSFIQVLIWLFIQYTHPFSHFLIYQLSSEQLLCIMYMP